MKKPLIQTRGLLFIGCILLVLFWLGLESELFARAGGGRSSGSRGYSSGGSSQRSPGAAPAPQQREYQQPRQQPQPPPASAGRSFLSGMAGGVVGGLLGGMLFRSLGFAGGSDGGGRRVRLRGHFNHLDYSRSHLFSSQTLSLKANIANERSGSRVSPLFFPPTLIGADGCFPGP